jgi:chromate transporter
LTPPEPRPGPKSLLELFLAFTALASQSFGGVLPWAHRVLVDQRKWLTREEFLELLAFSQFMPGPNICNLSILLGARYFGWRGAIVGLFGMLLLPAIVVVSIGVLYSEFSSIPVVRHAVIGMGAAAAGLIIATAINLARSQKRRWLIVGVLAFLAVGILRLPVGWVMLVLVPSAVAIAWRLEKP